MDDSSRTNPNKSTTLDLLSYRLLKEETEQQQVDRPQTTQASTSPSGETSSASPSSSSSCKCRAVHALPQCFKTFLKRKFSNGSDRSEVFSGEPTTGGEASTVSIGVIEGTRKNLVTLTQRKTPTTTPSTTPATTSPSVPSWYPSHTPPPAPKETSPSNLSNLFDSFIRTNLLATEPTIHSTFTQPQIPEIPAPKNSETSSSSSASTPPPAPKKHCQKRFLGLVNQIITNVFQRNTTLEASASTSPSSEPSKPILCQSSPTSSSFPADAMAPSGPISDKVYQQLIEFEFNYEAILQKFQTEATSSPNAPAPFSPSLTHPTLNLKEQSRICELQSVLEPLQYCLSSQSTMAAQAKADFARTFLTVDQSELTLELHRQSLQSIIKTAFNLLIGLAKQITSFSTLSPNDQMILLKNSVMEIMLLRSIMIRPQSTETGADGSPANLPSYCSSHGALLEEGGGAIREETGRESGAGGGVIASALDSAEQASCYALQFRAFYNKLERTIDDQWKEDKTIFYLLFAILLFRPAKVDLLNDAAHIRDEQVTYVYLLRRYLEHKFASFCTARSHFIRIFDRLEELHQMDEQVIQKLLPLDLVSAQNLLEKLCIC